MRLDRLDKQAQTTLSNLLGWMVGQPYGVSNLQPADPLDLSNLAYRTSGQPARSSSTAPTAPTSTSAWPLARGEAARAALQQAASGSAARTQMANARAAVQQAAPASPLDGGVVQRSNALAATQQASAAAPTVDGAAEGARAASGSCDDPDEGAASNEARLVATWAAGGALAACHGGAI